MPQPVCAIVGAGEGLGRSLAARFAREGFDLALVSRTEQGSSAAHASANAANPESQVRYFQGDATRPEELEQTLGRAAGEMGDFEVLIYNARGNFTACEPLEMTYTDLENIYAVEVMGAFAAARSVLPGMRKNNRGCILFSSATAAFRGSATHPLYAIGKFGLRALTQSLAKAYSKDGVHIVHVRLDCDLDMSLIRELYGEAYDPGKLANTDDVAESYWLTYRQPRSAWSNEIEIRPYTEKWTI